ncbi:hypothetical protein PENSUB_2339 [Penicillium subrubescens]|uniref:Uncharacterized protein n=2 Tax=Penicillium subrubescens TaxID=1316194 RepID=A0A1Q5UIB6_9EURO|nr:hypothetical protein PENSUB_2339 [Penicillium subrubescens]
MTPNEKSEIIQSSTNPDSLMSKLRQLVELGHHFDPVRQALEVLRNLNRDEDHDEWDSYDWQDWREFNEKIRDRETDNTASDSELSRNVIQFLEHIQAAIKAMVARCVKFPVQGTFYGALSTLCKIGEMLATSSSSLVHVAVRKWFASNTVLEQAIFDITNAIELPQLVLIFEDMTNQDALGPRLRELETLGSKHNFFSGLGSFLDGVLNVMDGGAMVTVQVMAEREAS